MNKYKNIILAIAMNFLYSTAQAGYGDCDGTSPQNCHPSHSCCSPQCSWNGDPACVVEGNGDNSIQLCTSSYENQGACTDNGNVSCDYTVTVTDPSTGVKIYFEYVNGAAATYNCIPL